MKYIKTCLNIILIIGISNAYAETGLNTDKPDPAYIESLKSSAASGNDKAQMKLAIMYLQGRGVIADTDKAISYYLLGAERNIAYAQYRLARLYLDGNYVKPDPVQGLDWLMRAAKLGFVQAQLDLSRLYNTGSVETPRDFIQSHKWLSVAASLTDADMKPEQEELEAKMSFTELARAKLLSNICIFTGYQEC